ncbi:MAG: rhomboid family intramembrane serine protease [Actinomycetia bacterium]|nr:rhomboid family intramembrane serine protease [Actinomycetes bacterium]
MSLPTPPTLPRCYRHPDREAGRSCTRCGKPACSDCLVQATVGSHCLDCAKAARPDIKSRAQIWNARQLTPVTMAFMAINIAVFVWMMIQDSSAGSGDVTRSQVDLGLYAPFLRFDHEWYRLVTSGFVHFGFIHLAFNMFALYQLGQIVERAVPHVQFALLYFAALLGGSLGALLVEGTTPSLTAGASGAVFGLLGAAAVGLHRRGINIFSTGIGTALMLNLVITFSISGISIGGHLGGLVAGGICGFVMLAPRWHAIPKWVPYVVPIAVGVVCVVASILYVNTLDFGVPPL